jgi:formylglycine-generating enzyme required for sulfatase activity
MRRLFQKRFSIVETVGLSVFVVLGISVIGYAVSIPNTFTSGTTISSSQVNANLTALADAINKKDSGCTGNSTNDVMVNVGPLCVDKYEASVWSNPDGTGTQYGDSAFDDFNAAGFPANGNWTSPLYAVSMAGVTPSGYISWFQAQQACALSGKRLLTNAEWQMAAAGTPDPGTDNGTTDCAVGSVAIANTGSRTSCVSKWGVNDMVGNRWEWVADWIQGNTTAFAASIFTATAGAGYGDDKMYGTNPATSQLNSTNFPAALRRGGSRASGADAGVFALEAGNSPSVFGDTYGFRCGR